MKLKLPTTELILLSLALAQAIGVTAAMIAYDGGSILAAARGGLLGASVSFGLALGANNIPRIQAKRRRQLGYVALVGLLIITPAMIAPATFASMPDRMTAVLAPGWLWALSICIAAAPDLVAIAVAAQAGALIATEPKPEREKAEAHPKPAAPVFACAKCKREFTTQNGLNAHSKGHKPVAYSLEIKPVEAKR